MEGLRLSSLLFGFLVILGFLTTKASTSISCYQCNSEYDPRCGDPFDPYSIGEVNCSVRDAPEHIEQKEAVLCRKNVQKVYGKIRVVRGCGYIENDPPRDEKMCMKRSGTHDVQVQYCICKGDLCNAATNVQLSLLSLALTAAVLTKTILL